MKLLRPLVLALLCSCAANPAPQAGSERDPALPFRDQQISVYFGERSLQDDEFWAPNEDQFAFGVEYSQEGRTAPVGWEVGLAGGFDESDLSGTTWTGTTTELYAGLRKSFGGAEVRPYVGGGFSMIDGEWETGGLSAQDSSMAGYLHGGIEWLTGESFGIGLDVRWLFGSDLTIAGIEGDADYLQAALKFGWRF